MGTASLLPLLGVLVNFLNPPDLMELRWMWVAKWLADLKKLEGS